MTAIAFGILWAAWTGGLYGYCLIRGYDISLGQLVNPVHPYKGPWPPPPATDKQIFPSGGKGGQAAPANTARPGGSTPIPGSAAVTPKVPGQCPPGYLWDGTKCLKELA